MKSESISRARYGCAVGAMQSAVAIPGTMPIADCGPGCADKQYASLAFYNGFQGSGYGGGASHPSINTTEKEVVFGGNDRLRELIQASTKVLKADLFVVTTGCISDIVGDDVASVVGEFQRRNVSVVYAETGGFMGNNFIGHEVVVKAVIDQYVGDFSGEKEQGLVNIWTELPYQNTFWRGDLAEIKRVLEGIGLKVNILFGHGSGGVEEWKTIPKAQFNIVIHTWLGLSVAEHLSEKYGQPFLHFPTIPIGSIATGNFLRDVGKYAKIDSKKVESFIESEERDYYKYMEEFSEFFSEYFFGVPSKFAVVTDSAYALAITKFAVNQLGLIPVKVILTENPPEEHRESIREQFRSIADGVSIEAEFIEDGFVIEEEIRNSDRKPAILFGTTWDRDIAKEVGAGVVEVSFPASYEVVLSRSYVGYRGALSLIEKIFTVTIGASA
jgi:nitrogenase molybdenum-iron protein beta chain